MLKGLLAVGVVAMLVSSSPANATTFAEQELKEFVAKSSTSVVGKITSVETKSNGGLMAREFTLDVSQTIYGDAGSRIKVTTPGGVVPNSRFKIAQVVEGSPQFFVGQEVMLVLNDMPDNLSFSVAGLSSGSLLVRNVDGKRFVNMNDGKGLTPISTAVRKITEMRDSAEQ